MELEIVGLIICSILLTAYLLMLREVIGMKKIIKSMLKRSRTSLIINTQNIDWKCIIHALP